MQDLRIRKETDEAAEYNTKLNNLRAQIDVIDNQLIDILGDRMKVSDGIRCFEKTKECCGATDQSVECDFG